MKSHKHKIYLERRKKNSIIYNYLKLNSIFKQTKKTIFFIIWNITGINYYYFLLNHKLITEVINNKIKTYKIERVHKRERNEMK